MECTGCGKDFDAVPVNVGPFRCPQCGQMVGDKAPSARYQVPSSWSDIPFNGGERFLIGTVCLVLNAALLGAVYEVGMAFAPTGEPHRTFAAMAVTGVVCFVMTIDIAITLATGWTGKGEVAGGGFHRPWRTVWPAAVSSRRRWG